jgi:hypothetical protein
LYIFFEGGAEVYDRDLKREATVSLPLPTPTHPCRLYRPKRKYQMQLLSFHLLAILYLAFHTEKKEGIRNVKIKITKLVRTVTVLKFGYPWIFRGRESCPKCFEQL